MNSSASDSVGRNDDDMPDTAVSGVSPPGDLPPVGLYARLGKPLIDRLGAILLLLLLGPLFVILVVLVRLDSSGGAFFVQERVGQMGRPFSMFKFRSMVTGAENLGSGILVAPGDARITRMGRFLRASSLDELPQLINIARGDMSFIGPRPTLEYQAKQYDAHQRRRLLVKPGLTGLAQIKGRKTLSWPQRIEYDVRYVDTLSWSRDLTIFIMTPITLLRGEGQATRDHWATDRQGSAMGRADAEPRGDGDEGSQGEGKGS